MRRVIWKKHGVRYIKKKQILGYPGKQKKVTFSFHTSVDKMGVMSTPWHISHYIPETQHMHLQKR